MEEKEKKLWRELIRKDDIEVKKVERAYRRKDKLFFENWFRDYLGRKDRKEERDNWL